MKITMIRHGETFANQNRIVQGWSDGELSELGVMQVEETAKHIDCSEYDIILCSDLHRTKQTAEIITKGFTGTLIYDKNLRECNFGDFENKPIDSFKEQATKETVDFVKYPIPNGERIFDFKKRVRDTFEAYKKIYANKNILVISHGGFITNIILTVLNLPNTEFEKYHVANASVTIVDTDTEEKVVLHNKTYL